MKSPPNTKPFPVCHIYFSYLTHHIEKIELTPYILSFYYFFIPTMPKNLIKIYPHFHPQKIGFLYISNTIYILSVALTNLSSTNDTPKFVTKVCNALNVLKKQSVLKEIHDANTGNYRKYSFTSYASLPFFNGY